MIKGVMKRIRFIRIELVQNILSPFWGIGILLVAFTLCLTLSVCGNYRPCAVYEYTYMQSKALFYTSFLAASFSSVFLFYDDIVHFNIRNMIQRMSPREYVCQKVIAVFLLTCLSYWAGSALFITGYGILFGFTGEESKIVFSVIYSNLLDSDHIILYFTFTILHMALLVGIISAFAAVLSILIPKLSVVFTLPITIFYLCTFYLGDRFPYLKLFIDNNLLSGGRIYHILMSYAFTAVSLFVLCMIAELLIRWRVWIHD